MKKRMKKVLAEYNKIMNDVSYGLDVLAKLNAEVSRCENRLQALAEICDFSTVNNGVSILKRVDELEKKYKKLSESHNLLVEIVEDINAKTHSHWWKW